MIPKVPAKHDVVRELIRLQQYLTASPRWRWSVASRPRWDYLGGNAKVLFLDELSFEGVARIEDRSVAELLADMRAGEIWQHRAEALWQLLDDIDTADDVAKDNEQAYRAVVRNIHAKRWLYADSDGHVLTWKGEALGPEGPRGTMDVRAVGFGGPDESWRIAVDVCCPTKADAERVKAMLEDVARRVTP